MLDFAVFALGVALLLGGGEGLVRCATALARSTGASHFGIGLTLVAFGTSLPELAVSAAAVLQGDTALAYGNIVGSNLANIGLVLGCASLAGRLTIGGYAVVRAIPMMLLATAVFSFMAIDKGLFSDGNVFNRTDGFVLLGGFVVYIYAVLGDSRQRYDTEVEDAGAFSGLSNLVLASVSLAALAGGARLTVAGGVGLAETLGVSQGLIGLALIAVGTSLPELVTSVIAAVRGHADLAVGNAVGSNILNFALVGGATASLAPLPVPPHGHEDLLATVLLSLLLWLLASRWRLVSRPHGVALLVLYFGYIGWRVLLAPR